MCHPKLYIFDTGTLDLPLESVKLNTFSEDPIKIPVPWYVFDHPEALVIIDGGNPEILATDPVSHWGEWALLFNIQMDRESACIPTLRRCGFDLNKQVYVVQTHLHCDHVGALVKFDQFPNAKFVVARREYEFALNPEWHLRDDYFQADFSSDRIPWLFIEDDQDGYDLIGDRSVILHHTPGHTPGHMSLELTLPETGKVILAGDASYLQDHWEYRAIPGVSSSSLDAVKSIRKLHTIAERTDALVYFGHDLNQWRRLGGAGVVYD